MIDSSTKIVQPSRFFPLNKDSFFSVQDAISINTKTEINIIIDKQDLMRCYKTLGRFAENADDTKEKFKSAN